MVLFNNFLRAYDFLSKNNGCESVKLFISVDAVLFYIFMCFN